MTTKYHDMKGDPIELHRLVRIEPDWAANVIESFNGQIIPLLKDKIAELEAENVRLKSLLDNGLKASIRNANRIIELERSFQQARKS